MARIKTLTENLKQLLAKFKPYPDSRFHHIIQAACGIWIVFVPLTHFTEIIDISQKISDSSLILHIAITLFIAMSLFFYHELEHDSHHKILMRFFGLLALCAIFTYVLMHIYVDSFANPVKSFLFFLGFNIIGAVGAGGIK